ncbi:MAG TPA: acyltransferase, partial [Gemmatimonadaceae bacterium]|nr:acyltransferase [Gemmatimonadaceae bacterium]
MAEPTDFHPARRHVPALDGVRGLAILAVMAFHFTLRMPDASSGDRLVHRVLGAGWAGVDLFFVLSGLLITMLLLDAKGAPHYYRTFYGRRALRIFPLYYGFLAAYFLLVVRTGTTGNDHYLWHEQGWWWSYLDNWWLAFVRRTEPPNYFWTGPFWSLAVEEQFYLVWPTLVLLLTRRRLAVVCGAIIVGAPIFRLWLRAHHAALIAPYALTPARLDSLAVGALLAVVLADCRIAYVGSRLFMGLGVMAAAISVAVFHAHGGLWTYGGWEEGPGYTIMAIAWGGLVAAGATAARGTIPARILGARWLRALGKYSYAMYVFHVPIWAHVQPLVFPRNRVPMLFGSHILASLALGALCGLLTFAAAVVSWNVYEKRFLKLKRYFAYAPKVRGA